MSRDIAGSNSAALASELFQTTVYKPNQGRIVRQLTALAVWVIVALGSWRLYGSLRGVFDPETYMTYMTPGIPAVILAGGLWFGYRLVNWPRFADFLIAVEAEMNKVTWPSKDELVRASIVVMFTIFFLAMALFLFDIIWQAFFNFIGVTS